MLMEASRALGGSVIVRWIARAVVSGLMPGYSTLKWVQLRCGRDYSIEGSKKDIHLETSTDYFTPKIATKSKRNGRFYALRSRNHIIYLARQPTSEFP